jgi:hypothetical protein
MAHHHHAKGAEFGPFTFLNPTSRRYPLSWKPPGEDSSSEGTPGKSNDLPKPGEPLAKKNDELGAEEVQRLYRTRDNRKGKSPFLEAQFLINIFVFAGRHAIVVTPTAEKGKYLTPPSTSTAKETLKGIWRMFSTYPYWDVSYLVAIIFTFGSVIWCINAFFVWLPLQDPSTEFPGEIANAGGITAFIGATIFEFGSILLMIEAVNENRADCFGWALEEVLEENGLIRLVEFSIPDLNGPRVREHQVSHLPNVPRVLQHLRKTNSLCPIFKILSQSNSNSPSSRLTPDGCTHHHKNNKNLVGKGKAVEGLRY